MIFRTPISLPPSQYEIDLNKSIFCVGSCFAENISKRMAELKFDVTTNPLGIVFNPASISKTLERVINCKLFTNEDLEIHPQSLLYYTLDAHSSFNSTVSSETLEKLNCSIMESHNALLKSSIVIVTLGTAWIYTTSEAGDIVSNCHKLPSGNFNRKMMSAQDISTTLQTLFSKDIFINKHIIITVSPVRHLKDSLTQNSLSKSTLICAVHDTCDKMKQVSYFPSYEIMMDDLRDYRFYESDMIHPSPTAIDYIWECFETCYIQPQTSSILREIEQINRALTHRPFNKDSESYKKFIDNTNNKIINLNKKVGKELFQTK